VSELLALWLPIIVATFAGFVLSFLLWALLPIHKGDFHELPDDAAFVKALEDLGLERGRQYVFPFARDAAHMKTQAFKDRYAAGPWGLLRMFPKRANMGQNLALTLGFFLVVNVLIGYVLSETLQPGAGFARVFQVATTIGVLSFTAGHLCNLIWFPIPKRAFATTVLDGVLYGLATGVAFAALWPAAPATLGG